MTRLRKTKNGGLQKIINQRWRTLFFHDGRVYESATELASELGCRVREIHRAARGKGKFGGGMIRLATYEDMGMQKPEARETDKPVAVTRLQMSKKGRVLARIGKLRVCVVVAEGRVQINTSELTDRLGLNKSSARNIIERGDDADYRLATLQEARDQWPGARVDDAPKPAKKAVSPTPTFKAHVDEAPKASMFMAVVWADEGVTIRGPDKFIMHRDKITEIPAEILGHCHWM